MIARLARVAALLIVAAAAIDPAWTRTVRGRATVAVVEPAGSPIVDRLRDDYRIVSDLDAPADAAVVVGTAYPRGEIKPTTKVATVTLAAAASPIAAVDAPAAVPSATTIHVVATVVRPERAPQTTVSAQIDGVVVAQAQHAWATGETAWRAALDLVPIGEAPWVVSLAADQHAARAIVVDRSPKLAVTFYEPRPSWTTTFVRRALERDGRFAVTAATRLEDADASAIVVGGIERVSEADASALDRFVRERGGAVVLLPDAPFASTSPLARMLGTQADEHEVMLEHAAPLTVDAPLPRLAASEMLTFGGAGADAIARLTDGARPVVWTARRGEGRVLVSGALDAWRFRADEASAFDRFWRAAVSSAALATPPLVDVTVVPAVARPLERVRVRARVHPAIADGVSVSASLASGDAVRLWPDAERGAFSGTFVAPANAAVSRVTVTATRGAVRHVGTAPLAIADVLPSDVPAIPLSLLSASHGGVDVAPSDLAQLDRWLRATVTAPDVRAVRHPMRSPWWMLPLFACLTIDWWITSSRRRRR